MQSADSHTNPVELDNSAIVTKYIDFSLYHIYNKIDIFLMRNSMCY
jgi:hypothetical protein